MVGWLNLQTTKNILEWFLNVVDELARNVDTANGKFVKGVGTRLTCMQNAITCSCSIAVELRLKVYAKKGVSGDPNQTPYNAKR